MAQEKLEQEQLERERIELAASRPQIQPARLILPPRAPILARSKGSHGPIAVVPRGVTSPSVAWTKLAVANKRILKAKHGRVYAEEGEVERSTKKTRVTTPSRFVLRSPLSSFLADDPSDLRSTADESQKLCARSDSARTGSVDPSSASWPSKPTSSPPRSLLEMMSAAPPTRGARARELRKMKPQRHRHLLAGTSEHLLCTCENTLTE